MFGRTSKEFASGVKVTGLYRVGELKDLNPAELTLGAIVSLFGASCISCKGRS